MTEISKIAVIGGGSTYTPEFIDGFIQHRDEITVREIVLHDIDGDRLGVVAGLTERMLRHAGSGARVRATLDRRDAIAGAEVVVSQIRVGGMEARIRDEEIPLRYGVEGQETTGPGGFFKALRTIPVSLAIARDIEKHAPNAWYLNFTNPSGIITEAILNHAPAVKVIGLCNVPITCQRFLADLFGVADEEVLLDWVGLNHLAWIRGVTVAGQERLPELLEGPGLDKLVGGGDKVGKGSSPFPFDKELIELIGMIPVGYLRHYYTQDRELRKVREKGTRAKEVRVIEEELLKSYADVGLVTKPAKLEERGGYLYSEAAIRLILSLVTGKPTIQIVNVRNQGSIRDLPDHAGVEACCVVGKHGARPLSVGILPAVIKPLVVTVKAYEQFTIEAGVTGSRKAALRALMTHPMVPSYDVAKGLLEEMLNANRGFLPQFFSDRGTIN